MLLRGEKVRLRALEAEDIDILYAWENDPRVWAVSETLAPFSRTTLRRFIDDQKYDLFQTRQMRLVVCLVSDDTPVGFIDLFDFDPVNRRAGVGILICDQQDRRQGYASEALGLLCDYARDVLGLHQLWCGVGADNISSYTLFSGKGFAKTGLKRDWIRRNEAWEDEIFMQMLLLEKKMV